MSKYNFHSVHLTPWFKGKPLIWDATSVDTKQLKKYFDSPNCETAIMTNNRTLIIAEVSADRTYGLSFPKNITKSARHSEINNILHRALSSINVPSTLEPPGLSRTDGNIGMETLIPWAYGKALIWNASNAEDRTYESANVSRQVTSHTRHLPNSHGIRVKPSARFLSLRNIPGGSRVDGILIEQRAWQTRPKIDEFRNLVKGVNIHCIAISESHFKSYITNKSVELSGFVLHRNDRELRRYGGVALYVRKGIPSKVILKSVSRIGMIEYLFVELCVTSHKVLLVVMYKPPHVDDIDVFESHKEVKYLVFGSPDQVLTDLNIAIEKSLKILNFAKCELKIQGVHNKDEIAETYDRVNSRVTGIKLRESDIELLGAPLTDSGFECKKEFGLLTSLPLTRSAGLYSSLSVSTNRNMSNIESLL
ncbi:hypothetical protein Bhyg_07103 [Pseudolycoriella hygida]|uniref:Uncharacterized protein n=1 Tax=Pseudolycoriella hygida TaxID=35572 RepID=A0A9Q0N3H2_9DIPT|nr:hypothetical protein Bhyg_07103 [Pseudolycoriella hygida]